MKSPFAPSRKRGSARLAYRRDAYNASLERITGLLEPRETDVAAVLKKQKAYLDVFAAEQPPHDTATEALKVGCKAVFIEMLHNIAPSIVNLPGLKSEASGSPSAFRPV